MNKKLLLILYILLLQLFYYNYLYAQRAFTLSGKILSSIDEKPVEFGTVLIREAQQKAYTAEDGSFQVNLSKPGKYTIVVMSDRHKKLETVIEINSNLQRDFFLAPLTITGRKITITDDRYLQKISRKTMKREELKATPASFGDAVSALTSMPGVDRTNGFFGPLTIRGMDPGNNRYYIDGIPITDPLHFGGLHSVINTNLMDRIDMFGSAFPVKYGDPLAAVIEIHTVDDVKESGGYADINMLSANALVQKPLTRTVYDGEKQKEENTGYVIASGRYSYFSLFLPFIMRNEDIEVVPEYYDYQLKAKYYLNNNNSLILLFFGGKDYFKFLTNEKALKLEDGDDPLLNDFKFETDSIYNNMGIYYTYKLDKLENKLMAFGALNKYYNYLNSDNADVAPWMQDFEQNIKPYIFGVKDTLTIEANKHWEVKLNFEYTSYYFKADGKIFRRNLAGAGEEGFDPADPDLFLQDELDMEEVNRQFGSYLENKFTYSGLTFVPGVRVDYLERTDETTIDPRGMISYEFPTETTISLAGGRYSSFLQTNPFLFSFRPDLIEVDGPPEKSVHSIAGIEQVVGLYTLSLEGYYNYFYNIGVEYPHPDENGEWLAGEMSGKAKVMGFEIMLRKDREENINDFFGWISYTYNKAREKTGITGNSYYANGNDTTIRYDPNGDNWQKSNYEREHSLKLVLGYAYKQHTISGKFQYYTSYPYTPMVGSEESPDDSGRYVPILSDDINSKNFKATHRLDLRYSYKARYAWGYVSWYIEVINVYKYEAVSAETWKYNKPYAESGSDKNPTHDSDEGLESIIIPNFGVEIKW